MVRLPKTAFPLGRLLGEDVATVCVAALELAGSGLPEALGRTSVGLDLDLRHCDVLSGFLSLTWAVAWATLSVLPVSACKSLIQKESSTGPGYCTASPANRADNYAG